MAVSRRMLILGAGGTGLLFAGGVWRVTRLPQSAITPWTIEGAPPRDVRLAAFRHAILAPNPHNRQPWLIRLIGADEAEIFCDLDKRLPHTDPYDRQITIGFGTFLETARIAAAQYGVRLTITPFPKGEPQPRLDARPVAHLRFVRDASTPRDPLFAAIGARRTNRTVFDAKRAVSHDDLAQMLTAPDGYTADARRIAPLRTIAMDAIRIEQMTHRTHQESVDLMRIGQVEIDAMPDGLALSGPLMESLALAGQLDRAQLADPQSTAFKTGLDMQAEVYGSTPALAWITTPANSRADQLEAGRRYVRANLHATRLGLSVHPMSQALQEYPEMAAQFAALHQRLGAQPGSRIQMFARIGYGDDVRPAARWPLEKHIIT